MTLREKLWIAFFVTLVIASLVSFVALVIDTICK